MSWASGLLALPVKILMPVAESAQINELQMMIRQGRLTVVAGFVVARCVQQVAVVIVVMLAVTGCRTAHQSHHTNRRNSSSPEAAALSLQCPCSR